MKHLLIPDLICDTVYEIPFSDYYKKGIRAIAFDIDNTLVSYDTPEPDEKLSAFLFALRDTGFSIAFVSNNDAARVERFNASLGFFALSDSQSSESTSQSIAPTGCASRTRSLNFPSTGR